jgi:hypothetical protein
MFGFKQEVSKNNKIVVTKNKYSFIDNDKKNDIINIINTAKIIIKNRLLPIINSLDEKLEGNIFMHHNTTDFTDYYIDKQINFILATKRNNINNILEIGFNAGFSTLLMLLSNKDIKITCVDICEHKYTKLCFEKLKELFGDRLELIPGSSVDILPGLFGKTYDLIHIDGCHLIDIAKLDIENSLKLSKNGTILIMDDTDHKPLYDLWTNYVNRYQLLSFYPGNFVNTRLHCLNMYNK